VKCTTVLRVTGESPIVRDLSHRKTNFITWFLDIIKCISCVSDLARPFGLSANLRPHEHPLPNGALQRSGCQRSLRTFVHLCQQVRGFTNSGVNCWMCIQNRGTEAAMSFCKSSLVENAMHIAHCKLSITMCVATSAFKVHGTCHSNKTEQN
jgi:hypothetical protein